MEVKNSPKIAVLLTCHNRKEKTLSALASLYEQQGIDTRFIIDIYLTDDGSTDGTKSTVEDLFPNVELIVGDGSLYWNKGMRLAWQTAMSSNGEYDFFCWLNDDVVLNSDALSSLLTDYFLLKKSGESVGAIVGLMQDENGNPTYGGKLKGTRLFPLKAQLLPIDNKHCQPCDFINGNLVLIPQSSVARIGILSDKFTHQMGDFDYSARLNKHGLTCWQGKGTLGTCSLNSVENTFRDCSLVFEKRVELLKKPNQIAPPKEWMYFIFKYGGPL
ncbi:glycosyltransferase family 2 protein, partial [Vibrio sp. M260118]|uniref:glycosyltransferase family 2 protein n=1 Tax=Vibrio sp. M260118 TaxID=3020896 RepID=UPI002F3EEAA8